MSQQHEVGPTTAEPAPAPARTNEYDPERFMPPAAWHAPEGEPDAMAPRGELNGSRPMWEEIQIRFVDEPRQSVEEADRLVASTIRQLADSLAEERVKLESQWAKGSEVSTEDLRLTLRRYRLLFDMLAYASAGVQRSLRSDA